MAWVEVDVNLSYLDTDDLIDELERRGQTVVVEEQLADIKEIVEEQLADIKEIVERIYKKRNVGDSFDSELYELFYQSLGRIV